MSAQSLLGNIKKDCDYKMFININGELYSISLHNESLTIKESIIESVKKFNI